MKKIEKWFLVFAVTFAVLSFVSCAQNAEDAGSSVQSQSTWKLQESTETFLEFYDDESFVVWSKVSVSGGTLDVDYFSGSFSGNPAQDTSDSNKVVLTVKQRANGSTLELDDIDPVELNVTISGISLRISDTDMDKASQIKYTLINCNEINLISVYLKIAHVRAIRVSAVPYSCFAHFMPNR